MADLPPRHVVVSGCSGGGKTTLIEALAAMGFSTVAEPGRRAIREGLSWISDPRRFAERLVALAIDDLAATATVSGPVFFDRGLIDAAVALDHVGGPSAAHTLASYSLKPIVFLVPAWPECFRSDTEREHDLNEAKAEYARLEAAYRLMGMTPIILPRLSIGERVQMLLSTIGLAGKDAVRDQLKRAATSTSR